MSTHQIDTMATDDIEMDLVDKLRLWASTEPSHVVEDLHKAADEIEHLRNEMANQNSEYNKLWQKHNAVMRDKLFPLNRNYTDFIHPDAKGDS